MPVDSEIQAILDVIAGFKPPPLHTLTPAEARVAMLKARALYTDGTVVPLARVEERTLPGPTGPLTIRVYAAASGLPGRALPVVLFFHGGGWVIGNLDSHDDVCRRLAAESGFLVVSVDYRLAPEHRFPAAVEDGWAALTWLAAHAAELGGDPTRIAVAGDSAGGNLAAVLALRAREAAGPLAQALALQVLIYPVLDCDFGRPSYAAHGEGYPLTRAGMDWFWAHYLPSVAQRADPAASPLRAERLAGAAPALVQLAEFDVLLDEGVAYAERLRAEGVAVTLKRYAGAIHGCLAMTRTALARTMIADAAHALKAALGG